MKLLSDARKYSGLLCLVMMLKAIGLINQAKLTHIKWERNFYIFYQLMLRTLLNKPSHPRNLLSEIYDLKQKTLDTRIRG